MLSPSTSVSIPDFVIQFSFSLSLTSLFTHTHTHTHIHTRTHTDFISSSLSLYTMSLAAVRAVRRLSLSAYGARRALSATVGRPAPFEYNVRFDGKRAVVTGASKGVCVYLCLCVKRDKRKKRMKEGLVSVCLCVFVCVPCVRDRARKSGRSVKAKYVCVCVCVVCVSQFSWSLFSFSHGL